MVLGYGFSSGCSLTRKSLWAPIVTKTWKNPMCLMSCLQGAIADVVARKPLNKFRYFQPPTSSPQKGFASTT